MGDPNKFGDPVKLFKPENPPCDLPLTHGYNGRGQGGTELGGGCRGAGVAEMAYAIRQGRPHRMSKEMAYHAMEVLHGFDVSAETGSVYTLESTFSMPPLKEGYYSTMWGGYARADAECSLME